MYFLLNVFGVGVLFRILYFWSVILYVSCSESITSVRVVCYSLLVIMPPTLKKLMGHIAFGACVGACVGGCVRVSHFLYLL